MCNFNVYNFIIGAVSILAAAIFSVLFYFGFITGVLPVVTIFAIIAAVLLAIILLILLVPGFKNSVISCACRFGSTIIVGSLGTIITTIIVNAVTITVGSVVSAIIIFVTVLFFAIAILGFIFLLNCILCAKCARYNNNCCEINDKKDNNCGCKFID